MKRLLLILNLALLIWLPAAGLSWIAQAQVAPSVPTLSNLEIALWPEYDRPEMLVIYGGAFTADTDLPVQVQIRIPARVGQPTAVAYVGEGGERFNQAYTTQVEGDWLVVSFELSTLGFQLEYYDEIASESTGQRTFAYSYVADYSVAALSLEVQVPPAAEDFVVEPAADSVVSQADGLTYHLIQAGPLAQGETRTWTITYQKRDQALTVSGLPQSQGLQQAIPSTAGKESSSNILIFVIAFVTLVAVGAGAFWLGRQTQPDLEPEPTVRRKRRGSGRAQGQQVPPLEAEVGTFCYRCGTRLRPDSQFCQKCGAPVREL